MRLGLPTESSLAVRLAWLTALRLLVITVLFVGAAWAYAGSGFAPGSESYAIALQAVAAAYVLALVYATLLRSGRALYVVAHVQLVTDQAIWTAIVYVTGGLSSGATSLYGLTCLSGAILVGLRGVAAAGTAAMAALVGLAALLATRVLIPPVDQPATYPTRWNEVVYPLFVNVLGVFVVAVLASYLAERLRAAGSKLAALAERAEQAERLGKLAAGLAHEIRNPLGAIVGSIELLRSADELSDEDRRLCDIIQRETSRLNELMDDLLDLARPRAVQRDRVDVCATARDVVTLASRSGRGGDVRVRFEGPAELHVVADAAQLRQIVWNLVRNAIQASGPGAEVLVRVCGEPGAPILEVVDHGQGIPADARSRIFEPYFSTRSHGTGIGLAVVKRIADDHGFPLEVDGVEGEGTTFRLRLSAALPSEPEGPLVMTPIPRRSSLPPRF